MQRFNLSSITPGSEARGAVCIRSRGDKRTKDGKPYIIVELGNATGRATARIWSEDVPTWEGIRPGAAVAIHGRGQAGWRGGAPELAVMSVERLPDDHPVRLELHPHSPIPRDVLEERFDGLDFAIRRPQARRLLRLVLERVGRERYFTAPAAVSHHHAYIGGLAEHSIEVTEMALALATSERYAGLIDRDAIIVGGLLHDIGKLEEYAWEGVPIQISRAGRLRSHVGRGAEIIGQSVADAFALVAGTVSELDVRHLQHVIESHHGQVEWGSPTPPRTMEATLIHHADLISARLRAVADDMESAVPDEDHWIDPPAWGRGPVWAFAQAIAGETEDSALYSEAPRVKPLPWEEPAQDEGETAALVLLSRGGDHA